MTRMTFLFFIIVLIVSCGGDPPHTAQDNLPTENTQSSSKRNKGQSTGLDGDGTNTQQSPQVITAVEERRKKSYQKLITGKWQASTDKSWIIEIANNTLKQSKKSAPPSSEEFTINIKCNQEGCASEYFWCITTKQDCFIVRSVDSKHLKLQLPNSDGVIRFTKV